MKKLLAAMAVTISMFAAPIFAKDIYVAPLVPPVACVADGTEACPYVGIVAALGAAVGGDTLLLADGNYVAMRTSKAFESPVVITSLNGKNAKLERIHFDPKANNITLRSLTITPPEGQTGGYLVRSYPGAKNITVDNVDLYSYPDYADMVNWTLEKWQSAQVDAIDLRGSYNTITNNKISAIFTGMIIGPNSIVKNNVIDGFMGDGGKATGGSVWSGNLIKNHFDISGFHTDGIQAATKSIMTDLTISDNQIFEWTYMDRLDHPMRGGVQGIGMFDGIYQNVLISNNLIVVPNGHGITVLGLWNGKVVNNTVVSSRGNYRWPWIMVKAHKDGRPSKDVLVANNVAASYAMKESVENNVVMKNNFILKDVNVTFVDPSNLDFTPLEGGPLIDTADLVSAPEFDLNGVSRMNGNPDIGAIELSRMCN